MTLIKRTRGPLVDAELTPALAYFLVTGNWLAEAPLRGWAAIAMRVMTQADAEDLRQEWADVTPRVQAETAACGFDPWCVTRKAPRGSGFQQWQLAFLQTHRVS
jgi:hypothetical protein